MKISKRIKSGLLATIMLVVLIIPLFPVVSYAAVSNIQLAYYDAKQGFLARSDNTYSYSSYYPIINDNGGTNRNQPAGHTGRHEKTRPLWNAWGTSTDEITYAEGDSTATSTKIIKYSSEIDSDYSFALGNTPTGGITVYTGGNTYAQGYSSLANGVTSNSGSVTNAYKLKSPGLYATYKKCGYYNGRSIDVRLTIVGWANNYITKNDVNGSNYGTYVVFNNGKPGVHLGYGSSVAVQITFYDSNTGVQITESNGGIQGYTNFTDIDGGQAIHLISGYENIYVNRSYDIGTKIMATRMKPIALDYNSSSSQLLKRTSCYTPLIYDPGTVSGSLISPVNGEADPKDASNWCFLTFKNELTFVFNQDCRYIYSDGTYFENNKLSYALTGHQQTFLGTDNIHIHPIYPKASQVVAGKNEYVANSTHTVSKTLSTRDDEFVFVTDYIIPKADHGLNNNNPSFAMYANNGYTYNLVNVLPKGLTATSYKLQKLPNDGSSDTNNYAESGSHLVFTRSTSTTTDGTEITFKSPTTMWGTSSATCTNSSFFDCTMRLFVYAKISDSTTLSSGTTTWTNKANIQINTNGNTNFVGTAISNKSIPANNTTVRLTVSDANGPHVSKFINSFYTTYKTEHVRGETITYTGQISFGTLASPTSATIKDTLPSGVTYSSISSLKIHSSSKSLNSSTYITNSSSGSNVNITLKSAALSLLLGETIDYEIKCTATDPRRGNSSSDYRTKTYDASYPNTLHVTINGSTYDSNTAATLYRSGVNLPDKYIDGTQILTDTSDETQFTVEHYVPSKSSLYYYGNYEFKDVIPGVLEVKDVRVKYSGSDASSLFNVSTKTSGSGMNTLTTVSATATSSALSSSSFYGRTYTFEIDVGLNANYNLEQFIGGSTSSRISNTATVTVDGNDYQSNTVYLTYAPKKSGITKEVYDTSSGTTASTLPLKVGKDIVTYKGEISLGSSDSSTGSIYLHDQLDENYEFQSLTFEYQNPDADQSGMDMNEYFNVECDDWNLVTAYLYDYDGYLFENLRNGEKLEYTLTVKYTGSRDEWTFIPNYVIMECDYNHTYYSDVATVVVQPEPTVTKSVEKPKIDSRDEETTYYIDVNTGYDYNAIDYYMQDYAYRLDEMESSQSVTSPDYEYFQNPYDDMGESSYGNGLTDFANSLLYEWFAVHDMIDDDLEIQDIQILSSRNGTDFVNAYNHSSYWLDAGSENEIYYTPYDVYDLTVYNEFTRFAVTVKIKDDVDLSDKIDSSGSAIFKNKAEVETNYDYPYNPIESNETEFAYEPQENSIDKYILNGSSKVTEAVLDGNTVKYTGSMTITDKYPVETIQFTDSLETGLTYKNLTVKLDGTDITSQIDNNSNSRQVGFSITPASSYNPSNCMGKTLTYTIECTYNGSNVQKINNTADLQTQSSDGTHQDTITSNNTILTRNINSSITKYINDRDTSYSLHKNSEDITYTGNFTIGTDLSSSLILQDDLASGLTYKSLKIYSPEFLGSNLPFTHSTDVLSDDYDVTSIAGTNSSSGRTVKYTFNSSNFDKLKGLTLSYELVVTASKSYNGSATSNEKIPNTMQLKVNGTTFNSNTPNLYRAGVAKPTKSVNKSSVANKTDDVVYTISHEVSSRTSEYYYNTYVISDQLDSVLKYKSSKIVNESNTDVSSSFTVSQSGNLITATAKSPTSSSFYGHTYKLQITAGIADNNTNLSSHTSSSGLVTIPNKAKVVVDGNTFETSTVNYTYQPKSSSITKYINDNDTSYSLHKNSEDITYTGSFTIGADLSSSLILQDNLASGLTYKSLIIYSPDWIGSGHPDTSTAAYYDVTSNVGTNSSSGRTVKFTFDPDVFDDLKESTLNYELVVTASKTYDGSATTDEIIPNTIQLIVDGKTTNSNTPNLYRAGVSKPTKTVNKSSVTNKTDEVIYTISHEVSSRTSEYYYNTYVMEDQLDPVFSEYSAVSTKIINESSTDVSSQFDISKTINSGSHIITVTATAKLPTSSSFYGHTYKLQITAHMPNNADLSSYANGSGLATIPNKAKVTVDGNAFETSTVNYTYQTKSDSINKYILNSKGQKVETDTLTDTSKDTVITYTGDIKIQDKDAITSIIITDKLDSNLTIKNTPSFKIGSKDITSYGTLSTDNNTIIFTPSSDKLSELAGTTITYTITCGIAENSLGKTLTIPNTIKLSVNGKETTSNETSVITSAPSVGNLAISKTVKNGTSNKAFAFTLTLNGTYQGTDGKSHNANEFTGQHGEITFTNGTANFNLSHGQKLTAKDIPDGLTYTVTESNDGFDTYVTDKSGKTTQGNKVTGTITTNETAEANFTNMPSPVLPITGGPGITGLITLSIILGLIGSLLTIFCVIKRKQLKVNSK